MVSWRGGSAREWRLTETRTGEVLAYGMCEHRLVSVDGDRLYFEHGAYVAAAAVHREGAEIELEAHMLPRAALPVGDLGEVSFAWWDWGGWLVEVDRSTGAAVRLRRLVEAHSGEEISFFLRPSLVRFGEHRFLTTETLGDPVLLVD
jgi:hypothetical protein